MNKAQAQALLDDQARGLPINPARHAEALKALIAKIEDNERLETERAEQWRLRRDAEADRDTLKAANLTLREDNERLTEALERLAEAADACDPRYEDDGNRVQDAVNAARATLKESARG